jgi:hypothetical protein
MIGPRNASALPAMPRKPKNSAAFSCGVNNASRLRVTGYNSFGLTALNSFT